MIHVRITLAFFLVSEIRRRGKMGGAIERSQAWKTSSTVDSQAKIEERGKEEREHVMVGIGDRREDVSESRLWTPGRLD
jgi:hypothetical protein